MKVNAEFIPQEPYAELTLRRFPTTLYKKIKAVSQQYHVSVPSLIVQCCEFALKSMGGESE